MLLVARQCSPYRSGEYAAGWQWLLQAARSCEVHVAASRISVEDLDRARAEALLPARSWIHCVDGESGPGIRRALEELHRQYRFDVIHQVTPGSFCEPDDPALEVAWLWGPVRGAETFPLRFLSTLPLPAVLAELAHRVSTWLALWTSRRIHRAAHSADVLLAATSSTRRSLRIAFGVEVGQLFDSGVAAVEEPDRGRFRKRLERQDSGEPQRPLRLLWAGDLIARNALPLLLQALASLAGDTAFELHVAGEGPLREQWQAQAGSLGLTGDLQTESQEGNVTRSHVQFLGELSPAHLAAELHAAELFCFTSLRSEGEQVIVDALAAGVPVLCFDQHGARDLVTATSGARIAVTSPRRAALEWAAHLRALAAGPELLLALSLGAGERACRFLWQRHGDRVGDLYLRLSGRMHTLSAPPPARRD